MQPGVEGLASEELVDGIAVVATVTVDCEKGLERQERPTNGHASAQNDEHVQPHRTAKCSSEATPVESIQRLHTLSAMRLSSLLTHPAHIRG